LPARTEKISGSVWDIKKIRMDSEMAGTLKVTLTKSEIGSTKKIRATLVGLGLTRREKTIVRKDTPEIRGMLSKVEHLVKIEEV
jgi:large subunit ribosomal protein L30